MYNREHHNIVRTSFIALAACLAATPALANERSQNDEIVVVASRTPERLAETAAPVSVVSAATLEDRQSQSVFDALRLQPGIDIGGGPRQQGEMPAIRGATGRQIVITVDGARRNTNETLRTPLYIDPSFVRQIETLRGASSALHGAGGLGGVLALETITAESQLAPGETVGARAFAQYASGADAQRYGGQVYGKNGPIDALFAVAFRDSGPIRQGGGVKLRPEDSNTKTWLAKLGVDLGGNFRLQGSHNYLALEDFGPNNPQADATFPYMQAHRSTVNESVVNLTGGNDAETWTLSGTVYRTAARLITYENAETTPVLAGADNRIRTTGGSLQSTFGFDVGAIANKLTVGFDAYEERNRSTSAGVGSTIMPDGRQSVISGFAQNEFILSPWLSVTPVVRWDQFKTSIDSGASPDQTNDRITFKSTAAIRPVEGLLVFASYGEAFRAPMVNELYQEYSVATGFSNFRPNPSLRPESATDINVGLAYAKSGLFTDDDHLTSRFTWFRSHVDDLITSAVVGMFANPFLGQRPILQYQNVNRARRRGIEAEIGYGMGPVDFSAAYSRMRAVDRDTGANLFSPPDKLNLGVGVQVANFASLRWNSQIIWAQDYDSTLLRRRPAYDLHDAFITLTPERLPLRLDVGMTNIFDKRYALYKNSTAYPLTYEEGRSIRVTLTARY